MGDVFSQLAYAEKIAKQYNQDIVLYVNGSIDNNKEYYETILQPCGILGNYTFVEEYPITEPVLFENTETFEEQLAERGSHGLDLIIDGDFFKYKKTIEYDDFKEKFAPSQELLNFMSSYGITENSLYIDAEPVLKHRKNEFVLAGLLLNKQLQHFTNKTFDKVFVRSSYSDFFKGAGFEEVLGTDNIVYIDTADIPELYRDATQIMFPYLCKSSVISNYVASWWGHVLNKQEGHEVGILFPYGLIKRDANAADGITSIVIENAIYDVFEFGTEEIDKQRRGEPSLFDGVVFEEEINANNEN